MSLQNKNDFTKIPEEFAQISFIPFGEKMGLQVINGMLRMATAIAKTKR
jgi:hypothetical protein